MLLLINIIKMKYNKKNYERETYSNSEKITKPVKNRIKTRNNYKIDEAQEELDALSYIGNFRF